MTIISVKAQFREVEARGRILFLSSSSLWQNWADVTSIFSEIEDELHFIMSCPTLSKRRTTCDKIIINTISEWNDHDNLTECFIIINPSEK